MYLPNPVRADSALAPDSRINDPAYGTVLVSVLGVDGTGRDGVTVRVTPESGGGGQTITDTIDPTDVDGCTYVLQVAPGKYKIDVERSNYIDANQVAVPSYSQQVVAAGTTTTASFQYDNAGTFTLRYAATSNVTPDLPSNLETTFLGGLSNYIRTSTASPLKLHPFASGYQALAGDPSSCLNVDPANWDTNSTLQDGLRPTAVSADPGSSATLNIPMGVYSVVIPNSNSNRYVTAIQQTTGGSGNPGCGTTKTYSYSTQYSKNATVNLALPYGTWKIYTGNAAGAATTLMTSGVTPIDGVVIPVGTGGVQTGVLGASTFAGNVLTLDPRQAL
jgi:hypothetical protein